ncbi:hypothetical protein D9619_008942 [Psilocybe cf. subviscida]|uniref:Uncharacterized protein n=1 Tax=Psilocybe cf. subviscida TaxID=2480587 RepID=A0A8H5FAG1_9AGAR|nr:hypothetical protein D9619_008942 [Psilocybe cf. subviscida]
MAKEEPKPCPCTSCNGKLRVRRTIRTHLARDRAVKSETGHNEELLVKKEMLSDTVVPPLAVSLSSGTVLQAAKGKKAPSKRVSKAVAQGAAPVKQIKSTASPDHPETNAVLLHPIHLPNNAAAQPTQQAQLICDPQTVSDVLRLPTYPELLNVLSILLREKHDLQAQLNNEQTEAASLREHFTLLQTYCKQVEEQLRHERQATWNVNQRLDNLLKVTEAPYQQPLKRTRIV